MSNLRNSTSLACAALLFCTATLYSQNENTAGKGYRFTVEKEIPTTPVKDQHRSGTCWSYATVSFIESELLRTGKGTYDLSEMFFVRDAFMGKAGKYVRMHGKNNFGSGGLAMDVLNTWKRSGMVPQEAYTGITTRDSLPVHGEMDAVLKGYIDQVVRNPNRELSPAWEKGFEGILDAYLGPYPAIFTYRGASYTPRSFSDGLGLNPADYVVLGSFTHHPFYEQFILEIPDNWNWSSIWNIPLDDMMKTLDHALEKGFTVCWDADVSEKGFDWKKGIALVPSEDIGDLSGLERARWDELSPAEQQALFYDFSSPRSEKKITQAVRQEGFDNYRTTDDHLMHITGLAKDMEGKRFYMVKNSWGTENHVYDGFIHVSDPYMRAKTIFIMVHRDAIPASLLSRLKLQVSG